MQKNVSVIANATRPHTQKKKEINGLAYNDDYNYMYRYNDDYNYIYINT